MISISSKNSKKTILIGITILFMYLCFSLLYQGKKYLDNSIEKQKLTNKIELKKEYLTKVNRLLDEKNREIKILNNSYYSTPQIKSNLKTIFDRFSKNDLTLSLLTSQKICIDRHLLVVGLYTDYEDSFEVGLRLLSKFGKVIPYKSSDEVFVIDYLQKDKK